MTATGSSRRSSGSKQSAYVTCQRIAPPHARGRRGPGTEMATTGNLDGLRIRVKLRGRDEPFRIDVVQEREVIQVWVGDTLAWSVSK